jgi:hypothetical protein
MNKNKFILHLAVLERKGHRLFRWLWNIIRDGFLSIILFLSNYRLVFAVIILGLGIRTLILWWPSIETFRVWKVEYCRTAEFELFLHYSDESAPGERKKIDITVRNTNDKISEIGIMLLPSSNNFIFPKGSLLFFPSLRPYESISRAIDFELTQSPFDELALDLAYIIGEETRIIDIGDCTDRIIFRYNPLLDWWNNFLDLPVIVSNLSTFLGFISSLLVTVSIITGKSAELFNSIFKVLGFSHKGSK